VARKREPTAPRIPLSRERVLRAAVAIADEGGLDSLTMRRLAEALDAEAMSLYYHVANKDEVLDGIVDAVAAEINDAAGRIDLPTKGADWKKAARARILSAREVLLRHRWAPGLFETRTNPSPAILQYYDALLGLMRDGGFSYDLAHHAMHALGSRALGFSQELFDPGGGGGGGDQSTAALESMAERFPHLVAMVMDASHGDPGSTLGWCDSQIEFEFGLDVILDGLDRLREAA
jgi:AcrR family transcriptional regulator